MNTLITTDLKMESELDKMDNLSDEEIKKLLTTDMSEAYKDRFVKIPNEYFNMLQYDEKLFITIASLSKYKTIYNTMNVTLKDIITDNAITPVKGKGRNIEHFKISLFNLMNLKIIMFYDKTLQNIVEQQYYLEMTKQLKNSETTENFERLFNSITLNTPLSLRFNEMTLKTLTGTNFTILEYNILNIFKQACIENNKLKMTNLVNVYMLIKKHILANKYFSGKEWNLSIHTISETLKLKKQTICDTIKTLKELQVLIVYTKENKNYYRLNDNNNNTEIDTKEIEDYE